MKTLVILAHPDLEKSHANRMFAEKLKEHPEIDMHLLYRTYPAWQIDVSKEQELLLNNDRIVFQFPFYWYSCPPLLKKWLDDVLTFGWAYGPGGNKLKGKEFIVAVTTGSSEKSYQAGGDNFFTADEYLLPFRGAVLECGGIFLPPFIAYEATFHDDATLEKEAENYIAYIEAPASVLTH